MSLQRQDSRFLSIEHALYKMDYTDSRDHMIIDASSDAEAIYLESGDQEISDIPLSWPAKVQ